MVTLDEVANDLANGKYANVVFMVGAGISTGAGIPDFRTPGTGIYSNLQRLNLPYPEAVFDISYLRKCPEAFYTLAKELYPGQFEPTLFHKFMRLVEEKGYLRRLYTQNIDTLERIAGISHEKVVEAHGSFASNHCIECGHEMSNEELKAILFGTPNDIEEPLEGNKTQGKYEPNKVPVPQCRMCKAGIVKPDIVFFGEGLPELFFQAIEEDLPHHADLVIVAGTSLTVSPFSQLPELVSDNCVRVLFNIEQVGSLGTRKRDVLVLGDCDQEVERFLKLCGWWEDLNEIAEEEIEERREADEKFVKIIEDLANVKLAEERTSKQYAETEKLQKSQKLELEEFDKEQNQERSEKQEEPERHKEPKNPETHKKITRPKRPERSTKREEAKEPRNTSKSGFSSRH